MSDIESNFCCTAPLPGQFDMKPPTEEKFSAMKLRSLMMQMEGEKKCTLCEAAKLLEKKDTEGNPLTAFPLLMAGMMLGGNGAIDPAALRAIADAMENEADKSGK